MTTGCGNRHPDREFKVVLYHGGWPDPTTIYCDSVQMESINHAYLWVDGFKMEVWSDEVIKVSSN